MAPRQVSVCGFGDVMNSDTTMTRSSQNTGKTREGRGVVRGRGARCQVRGRFHRESRELRETDARENSAPRIKYPVSSIQHPISLPILIHPFPNKNGALPIKTGICPNQM